jgi:hypothetical protein
MMKKRVVYKETRYLTRTQTPILVIADDLIEAVVGKTVNIDGSMFRVGMVTDEIVTTKYGVEIYRVIKMVEKKYF